MERLETSRRGCAPGSARYESFGWLRAEFGAVGGGLWQLSAKGSEIHGRAEGADLQAAPSAESGALVYGNIRLRMLSPPGARSVWAAARLPLRHHRAPR
jgi:hypothetical protein